MTSTASDDITACSHQGTDLYADGEMSGATSSVDMLVVSVFERELTFLDTMRVNPDTPDLLKTAAPATYAVIRDHLNNRLRALKRD